ncbi:MAG: hypothetical protein IAG13_24245 [Deltaproteobacteria bacterium]|nr:hypothetical protein [Nannocystaceae bacterium]
MKRMQIHATLFAAVLVTACDGGTDSPRMPGAGGSDPSSPQTTADDDSGEGDSGDESGGTPSDPEEVAPLSIDETRFYLARIAPQLASRSLSYDENQLIDEVGHLAIAPIIDGWTAEPGFAEAIRFMVQDQLHVSGARDGVDFELPGNLAAEIAAESLPWSTLLTADYCVDAGGRHTACDTGAPYESGVLATRAYMISNKGRFNLGRAKQMLETFACRVYPMESEIQVPLDKPVLIPMFQAESADEQTVEEAKGGFGNGAGCYSCHSQFGAHAQIYVRFDADGLWHADATGLQDPMGELGRSTGGLYTSHMNDAVAAMSEASQMFGQPVANMREAAEVLSDSALFQECTVKNIIGRAFGIPSGASAMIEAEVVSELAQQVTADSNDPSIRQYMIAVFNDRRVIDAVLANMEDAP